MKQNIKITISGLSAGAILLASVSATDFIPTRETKADAAVAAGGNASVTEELTAKRTAFVKQFAQSDGSYTAVTYSMPVHYKKSKGGAWKEIDTTLVKSGKKKYKTKATDLSIKVSQKANRKSVVSMKRGKTSLSIALKGKKLKAAKAKRSNPKKKTATDVLNQNKVTYKKIMKNTSISYDIFPEKVQEIVSIHKKQKRKALSFKLNTKLKIKVKGRKIYFKTKKGKTKFTRMNTKITDASGVTTSKAKLSYNKKKKTLKVTPDKKWWNSKKRKFPLEIRTTYLSDKHSRDVKVGAAYAGSPDSNYGYDKSLLLQANKCVAFTKMSTLSELKNKDVQIRDAALHIKNEKTLKLGAGKTFDIGIHKVKQNWSANKLIYNNRPAYEPNAAASMGIQKAGGYQCDVTDMVKAWAAGEANYGVALVADNSNRAYQAKIDRNPYFTVHYEIVGFDGAVELKENQPITRSVITAGQENYYYFDAKPGIAYDIYSESSLDTQAVLYDTKKQRAGYDDNSGLDSNFLFTGAYNGRKYLKVNVKNKGTGSYTLHLKKRFAIPEPAALKGQDKVTITWNAVDKAKEYLVCVYDGGKKISEAVVKGTAYDYIYNNETAGKTLGFTVTARENASLTGETSRMIFNTNRQSEWVYTTPMQEARKNSSVTTLDGKIYVLGGQNAAGSLKSFAAYDTEKKTWETLPDYPGTETGICKAAMFPYNNEIYVVGGQTDTGAAAKLLKSVYVFNTDTKQWQKKANMAEGRTNAAYAVSKDSLYLWTKAGATDKAEVYNIKTDTWETAVMPDTSSIIDAASVDNRVFVLKEDGETMFWQEYLPEDNAFEDADTACVFAPSGKYKASAVIRGKIYMVKEAETKEVLVYDAYADEWSRISAMNLTKKDSTLAACGNDLYSIGGEMSGYGILDVVEQYTVKVQSTTKEMVVKKGEAYELQVTAGNLKKGQTKIVSVAVNAALLKNHKKALKNLLVKYEKGEGRRGMSLDGKPDYEEKTQRTKIVSNESHNVYGIASGWRYDFPWIETVTLAEKEGWEKRPAYLHYGSAGVIPIKTEQDEAGRRYPIQGLENYEYEDVKLEDWNKTVDGTACKYLLRDKTGLRTYFNENGVIVLQKDAHGNTIRYTYTDGIYFSKITDSVGREIKFHYSESDGERTLTKVTVQGNATVGGVNQKNVIYETEEKNYTPITGTVCTASSSPPPPSTAAKRNTPIKPWSVSSTPPALAWPPSASQPTRVTSSIKSPPTVAKPTMNTALAHCEDKRD